jgi:repressor LexA
VVLVTDIVNAQRPTEIQASLLSAIERRLERGESVPTYRELCKQFGWSSTATVRDHLRALARKGYIDLSGPGHRQIKLRTERPLTARVPLIGHVEAGRPILAEENIEGQLPVPMEWVNRGSNFALRVHGDSMAGAGIQEGDYVVVRQQPDADHGDIVVATIQGDTTLKRFWRSGKRVELRPENPRYQPIKVQGDLSMIQGVIVGLMRSYSLHGSRISHSVRNSGNDRG